MAYHRTLRAIAQRMGWKSATTVLRRRDYEAFPIFRDFTRQGAVWTISDEMIAAWELAKATVDARNRRIKRPWTRKPSAKKGTPIGTRRAPAARKQRPSLHEGIAKLTPAEQAWIFKNELTPAQREELGVKVGEMPPTSKPPAPPAPVKKVCTCGTPVDCTAHD